MATGVREAVRRGKAERRYKSKSHHRWSDKTEDELKNLRVQDCQSRELILDQGPEASSLKVGHVSNREMELILLLRARILVSQMKKLSKTHRSNRQSTDLLKMQVEVSFCKGEWSGPSRTEARGPGCLEISVLYAELWGVLVPIQPRLETLPHLLPFVTS